MPNGNTFWNIDTHAGKSYMHNPPATSWSEWRTKVCLVCLSPLILSASSRYVLFWSPRLVWRTCCSYSWDSKTQTKHSLELSEGFKVLQPKDTRKHDNGNDNGKDGGTKSQTLGIKNSLWVGLWSFTILQWGEKCTQRGEILLTTTYGFGFI